MSDDKLNKDKNVADSANSEVEDTRRKLLKRLGKYGAYTAPTMLSLMVADKAAAQSGGSILPPPSSSPPPSIYSIPPSIYVTPPFTPPPTPPFTPPPTPPFTPPFTPPPTT